MELEQQKIKIIELESHDTYVSHIRPSKELMYLIKKIKAICLLHGKKVPSTEKITKKIVNLIDEEELKHEFI
jgi:metallophosphoesterase superfamily enzyme